MEVIPVNYMPGDPMLIEHIVCELKSQGIFDSFRKECIADVDTKPAYQNLRQRVEGSVTGFLKKQKWNADMNKNHVREMLRKNIYESGFLETGVERIVDQVVNPKMNSVFLPKITEVVYKYLGINQPDRAIVEDEVESMLPKDLEAVSPISEKKDDQQRMDVSDDKLDDDESPPFEPIDDALINEENSIDSHISGFSGLGSHDSNQSDNKQLQIDLDVKSNSGDDSAMKANNESAKKVRDDKKDRKERHSTSSSSRHKSRSSNKDVGGGGGGKERSKDHRNHHSSSSSKSHHRSHHRSTSSSHRKDSTSTSSKTKDNNKSRDRKSSSSSNSKTKSSSSRHDSRDKKDAKKRPMSSSSSSTALATKDDHFSSKHGRNERQRSNDRDSNDGGATIGGAKSASSSSHESTTTSSQNSTNNNNTSSSNDSKERQQQQHNRTTHDDQLAMLKKPKFASNIHEAKRLMKIRKEMKLLEAQSQKEEEEEDDEEEKGQIDVEETKELHQREHISVSADKWEELEAKLNSNINYNAYGVEEGDEEDYLTTPSLDKSGDDEFNYFTESDIDGAVALHKSNELALRRVEQEIGDLETNVKLSICNNVTSTDLYETNKENVTKMALLKRRRLQHDPHDGVVKRMKTTNNNNSIDEDAAAANDELFALPLSPAESDSSFKQLDGGAVTATASNMVDVMISKRRTSHKVTNTQRYASEDLYKPRPVFKSSTRRRGGTT